MTIVIAIPTIEERGKSWQEVAEVWYELTPEPTICIPSWRKGGWAQGLNEAWETHPDCSAFVCGSDDMRPEEGWWEAVTPYLDRGVIAPQVVDPRFTRFGPEIQDGQEVDMSSFPIMSHRIACQVFPLPDEGPQHYYADNYISDLGRKAGFPTIAVPSAVIVHGMDHRGRGAGMGDESTRMAYDKAVYKRILTGS